jgi:hypothetical protein
MRPAGSRYPAASDCTAPVAVALPSWLEPIPLPDGSTVTAVTPGTAGQVSATLTVPMSAPDFLEFVKDEWPTAGIQLGRGESEDTESEATFGLAGGIGAFKANNTTCPAGATVVIRLMP